MNSTRILIGHYLKHENVFIGHITVADSIALTNQGLALVLKVLSANQCLFISHYRYSSHRKSFIPFSSISQFKVKVNDILILLLFLIILFIYFIKKSLCLHSVQKFSI